MEDQNNLRFRWKQWSGRLEHLLKVSKTVDDDEQLATLFLVGGSRLEEIHRTLPKDTHDTVNTKYKKAIQRLTQYFNPILRETQRLKYSNFVKQNKQMKKR